METTGGNTNENVALFYLTAIDKFVTLNSTHTKASQVIFTRLIHPRHFSGLAPN